MRRRRRRMTQHGGLWGVRLHSQRGDNGEPETTKAALSGGLRTLVFCEQLVAGDEVFFLRLGRSRGLDLAEGDEAGLLLLLEDFLAVELGHACVLGVLLQLRVASADLLFARVLGDAGLFERVVG